jgi:formylglycine-generating enzyme required for sulfatase activity
MTKRLILATGEIVLLATSILHAQGVFEKRVAPVASDEKQRFQKQVKVALVVGVSKYPEVSGFAALNYAASDATEVGATLKSQGYLVSILTDGDATRGAIVRTLHQLSDAIDPAQGTFLFYFSGHGFSIGTKNHLAPVSASESDLEREGLSIEEVEQLMAASKAKRQLMLLDACRNDPWAGSKGGGGRSFAAFEEAEGLRILNSTRLGRVSYESSELQHGVFTAFVLDALKGKAAGADGLVTFHDLSDYVTDSVRRWGVDHNRVQVPYEAVGPKEASGDFLLASISAAPRPEPSPAPVAAYRPPAPSPVPAAIIDRGPAPGTEKANPKDGQKYVWIPAGSFIMGCSPGDNDCRNDEKPAHEVHITKGFWLGQTPVTQEAYQRAMGTNPSTFKGETLPVERVSWEEAKSYCELIGGRLPTEAEWEYAARAGTTDARYGNLDAIAWYDGNSNHTTHPVATRQPNGWNLYDMLGNVWEWTADGYGDGYHSQQESGDPHGPSSGYYRVLRGGSWGVLPQSVRASIRVGLAPGDKELNLGCRCVWELP